MAAPTGSLDCLDPYALDVGDRVLIELLVTDERGKPAGVNGAVKAASSAVLVVENSAGRLVRIPWGAIATIADEEPHTSHPGLD